VKDWYLIHDIVSKRNNNYGKTLACSKKIAHFDFLVCNILYLGTKYCTPGSLRRAIVDIFYIETV
jgi:hypothetical protein